MTSHQLLGEGVTRSNGNQARRYNLLAARLIAELVRNTLGPRGMDKMFIDLLGEVTVTKDGAALLRKIDVEHPAAKVIIDASNAVDNEVGDGTTSVVVFAGALVKQAESMLDLGIAPSTISDGYSKALKFALQGLQEISINHVNSDRHVMTRIVRTCLQPKILSYAGDAAADMIIDAVCRVADFGSGKVEVDDIKIEEKPGSISDLQLITGIVLDKTIDSSSMSKSVEDARILLIDEDLDGKRTRTEAEVRINSPDQMNAFSDAQKEMIMSKLQHIVSSGANVVISRKGINTLAQNYLREAGIISVRRVKENDLIWLAKATGATIAGRLDHEHAHSHDHHNGHHHHDHEHEHDHSHYQHKDIDIELGYAKRVYEKFVGDDRMVFIEGCKNPKSVTLLLRANSKRTLDECHRSALDGLHVLRNFVKYPSVVTGGGAAEMAIARTIRQKALAIAGREQIAVRRFADALEEIPITIARNAGMDEIDTLTQLRSRHSVTICKASTFGVDAINRKVTDLLHEVLDPSVVKEQVIKTAAEVTMLLLSVDDVLMAKPVMHTHTHDDGTKHSHAGGDKTHAHDHFDRLGKRQRPGHHYY
jgi:chaperonin GroEL (HSP60 family)